MTRNPSFPDAPPGSWVCEEGWLVVGDQAWTEHEWSVRQAHEGVGLKGSRPILYDDERHRKNRERKRRPAA